MAPGQTDAAKEPMQDNLNNTRLCLWGPGRREREACPPGPMTCALTGRKSRVRGQLSGPLTKSPKRAPFSPCRRRRKESLINGFGGEQAFAVPKNRSETPYVVSYNGLRKTLSLAPGQLSQGVALGWYAARFQRILQPPLRQSSVRSAMFIAQAQREGQAPSGAAPQSAPERLQLRIFVAAFVATLCRKTAHPTKFTTKDATKVSMIFEPQIAQLAQMGILFCVICEICGSKFFAACGQIGRLRGRIPKPAHFLSLSRPIPS